MAQEKKARLNECENVDTSGPDSNAIAGAFR
jgi:hypothetical protein